MSVVCWMRSRWSRPCGLGLGGLGHAASALVVSALVVSALVVSAPVVSTCAVSAPVASTLRSRLRWSRPVRPRPPRRCHIALCLLCFLVFSSSRQSTSFVSNNVTCNFFGHIIYLGYTSDHVDLFSHGSYKFSGHRYILPSCPTERPCLLDTIQVSSMQGV
jgi:hypothetical protein